MSNAVNRYVTARPDPWLDPASSLTIDTDQQIESAVDIEIVDSTDSLQCAAAKGQTGVDGPSLPIVQSDPTVPNGPFRL